MSDIDLFEKITESFTEAFSNSLKKTNLFDKFVEVKQMCSGLIIFTTITSLTLLFYQSYNTCAIESIIDKNYSIANDIHILNKKMEKIIETNERLYEIIIQNNKLSNKFIENQLLHTNNTEIEKESEDNELLDECYDVLPCNNSKKVTGLNKIFNWN